MRWIYYCLIFIHSGFAFGSVCDESYYSDHEMRKYLSQMLEDGKGTREDLEYAKNNLSVKYLREQYEMLGHEPLVIFETIEQARFYALNHPAFKIFEFGFIGGVEKAGEASWNKFTVTMEKSSFYGKVAGWEKKLPDGRFARYRLDWDPEIGGHINLEFIFFNENQQLRKVKLAVGFNCAEKPCTDLDVMSIIQKLQ